jgi:microcystin-dependent protein
MFAGNFAPVGWEFCNGQELPISNNEVLFQLIGTTYGGNGEDTFNLPNLMSRVPIHQRRQVPGLSDYNIGDSGGVENVTITPTQLPIHTHAPLASNTGSSDNPTDNFWANSTTGKPYSAPPPGTGVTMNSGTIGPAGGSQPHDNMMPFLCVHYIICVDGPEFPQPS